MHLNLAPLVILTALAALGTVRAAHAQAPAVTGVVHEAPPTERTPIAGARVAVRGRADAVAITDDQGRFTLPVAPAAALDLEVTRDGFEPARVPVIDGTRGLDVALLPVPKDIQVTRSGENDCTDLPAPPAGVPGLREYARFPVHHDGILTVTAAKLPFYNNPGYVYRQKGDGWEPNESDYILIRTPIPVLGGHVYVLTFGGDKDLCGPWSLDATRPN